ncbi:MAG: type II toxin-antitoxin system RelE family toxin [Nitrososphaerales archaeon]
MVHRIEYKSSVSHDLKQLDKKTAERILSQLREILLGDPLAGERLQGEFKGLYKLRLGEYRVIYTRTPESILVLRLK